MVKKLQMISLIMIYCGVCMLFYMYFREDKIVDAQKEIVFNIFDNSNPNYVDDYLGYLYVPKYDFKRVIKSGTDSLILDSGFVGIHRLSGDLTSNDLIILAGHNIKSVFSFLHSINIGDDIYINSYNFSRKFNVYDKKVVNEYDFSYLVDNRNNELLLITCTRNKGERLLIFLKEDL